MKQTQTLVLILALALTFGLASCKKENNTSNPQAQATSDMMSTKCGRITTPPPVTYQPCGTPLVVDLIAGQHTDAGSVTVANDANNLYVTYTVTGNWRLSQLHLYAGDCAQIPVNNSGNPVPGQFPYATSFNNNNTRTYTFTIPLTRLGNCFCVAAHATLSNTCGSSETAWGAGTRFTTTTATHGSYSGGGNWATYFSACKQPCTTTCILNPQLLFNGENAWPNAATVVTVGGYNYTASGTSTIYYNDPANDAKNGLLLVATLKLYGNTISPPSNVTSAATIVENWLATLGQITDTSQFTAPSNVQTAISTLATWESSQYCP
ncbi:MAG: hypothetical protein JWO03_2887 [Bacteroidetes bacterium]|nr:hypothetical protein [Bacteroidota bacterium]